MHQAIVRQLVLVTRRQGVNVVTATWTDQGLGKPIVAHVASRYPSDHSISTAMEADFMQGVRVLDQ